MVYGGQTNFYRIPYPLSGQYVEETEESKRYTIVENQLRAGMKGTLLAVFEDGNYTAINNGDGTYDVSLSSTGANKALMGICNGGLVETSSTIYWESIPTGSFYYLYAQYTTSLYVDPTAFNLVYFTAPKSITETEYLFLATLDLTGAPVLDSNPDGKLYSTDFTGHLVDYTNPHSTDLHQDVMTIAEQVEFDIPVTAGAGALIYIDDERVGDNPTIESTGDIILQDGHVDSAVKLSDASNTYLTTTNETIIGAINEANCGSGFGAVVLHKPYTLLKFDVRAVNYINGSGTYRTYAGATDQNLTPSATNYIYLSNTGALALSTTSFPSNAELRLAQVVCDASTVTSFTDSRPFISKDAGVTVHNDLSGIQGGAAAERYHLTNAQHTEATQYASAVQNGLLQSSDYQNIPAIYQKSALAGSYGLPTSVNKYVTEIDPMLFKIAGVDNYWFKTPSNNDLLAYKTSPTTYVFYNADLGPLAWDGIYPMEDANDYSGNSNNLTNSGVTFPGGKHNNCGDFVAASNDYLTGSSMYQYTGEFCVAFWVNLSSIPSAGNYQTILGIWEEDNNQRQWVVQTTNTGFRFMVSGNGTNVYTVTHTPASYTTSTWYFVIVYFNPSMVLRLHVDTVQSTGDTGPASLHTSTAPFYMGCQADSAGAGRTNYFDGLIDEVYIDDSNFYVNGEDWLYNSGAGSFADNSARWESVSEVLINYVRPRTSTGLRIGYGTSDKVAAFDATPVAQQNHIPDPAAATATTLSDNTGGAVGSSLEAITGISGADQTNLNNNFASVGDRINNLITDASSIRTAVIALLARLEVYGFSKTS